MTETIQVKVLRSSESRTVKPIYGTIGDGISHFEVEPGSTCTIEIELPGGSRGTIEINDADFEAIYGKPKADLGLRSREGQY